MPCSRERAHLTIFTTWLGKPSLLPSSRHSERTTQRDIVRNARALAESLAERGFDVLAEERATQQATRY